MKCDKCGKYIPEQIDYCPTCKIKESRNQKGQEKVIKNSNEQNRLLQPKEEINQVRSYRIEKNNRFAIISFEVSLILIFLFIFYIFVLFYLWISPKINEIPVQYVQRKYPELLVIAVILFRIGNAASLVTGIVGLHSKRKFFAIVGVMLSILTFIFLYSL